MLTIVTTVQRFLRDIHHWTPQTFPPPHYTPPSCRRIAFSRQSVQHLLPGRGLSEANCGCTRGCAAGESGGESMEARVPRSDGGREAAECVSNMEARAEASVNDYTSSSPSICVSASPDSPNERGCLSREKDHPRRRRITIPATPSTTSGSEAGAGMGHGVGPGMVSRVNARYVTPPWEKL